MTLVAEIDRKPQPMYLNPPPQRIATETFSVLPDRFRQGTPRTPAMSSNFLEGPSFDRQGNLYCVDIPRGRIYRITPEGTWDIAAEYDGVPNGLKIHRDGRIFVADRKRGIVVFDPATSEINFPCGGPDKTTPFKGLNDLIFANNGDLYFTDQGHTGLQDPTGRVYKMDVKGSLTCIIDNVPSPNGLVFNVRQSELFVAVTRANAVWRIFLSDTSHRTGLYIQLPSPGPDGLALDVEGNVAVGYPGPGAVAIVSKFGAPVYYVETCSGNMTVNMAYGGIDNRTLYITEGKTCSIITAQMPVAGQPMYSHAAR